MSSAPADDLRERANAVFKPLPSTVPAVKDNRITEELWRHRHHG
jgi:cytochrome c peroxidase